MYTNIKNVVYTNTYVKHILVIYCYSPETFFEKLNIPAILRIKGFCSISLTGVLTYVHLTFRAFMSRLSCVFRVSRLCKFERTTPPPCAHLSLGISTSGTQTWEVFQLLKSTISRVGGGGGGVGISMLLWGDHVYFPGECCDRQVEKYMFHGHLMMDMTPSVYFHHLTNYHLHNITVNYLRVRILNTTHT